MSWESVMHVFVVVVSVVIAGFAVPYVWRAIAGPTVFDRVIALNAIGTKTAVLFVMIGLVDGRLDMYVDLALGLILLNLFIRLLVAKYVRMKHQEAA